ncbi:MAG: ATP-binding protein [Nanoarchaeota archaeon]
MNNPLTLEEKVTVPRLLDHDLTGVLAVLLDANVNPDLDFNSIQAMRSLLVATLESVKILTRYDNFRLDTIVPEHIEYLLSNHQLVQSYFEKGTPLSIHSNIDKEFRTQQDLVQSALHNLIKNSSTYTSRESGHIDIYVRDFSGEVPSPAYVMPDTPLAGDFVKFDVQDNGPGFSTNRPLNEFLQLGVTSRERGGGFGLYYVGLVAKVLRSHIGIESEPGNTTVSLYHPLNLE